MSHKAHKIRAFLFGARRFLPVEQPAKFELVINARPPPGKVWAALLKCLETQ
jgi:hypothetical protein